VKVEAANNEPAAGGPIFVIVEMKNQNGDFLQGQSRHLSPAPEYRGLVRERDY
jgi:hypothetical protein